MKLRNKRTGEIIETQEIYENLGGKIRIRKKAEEIDSYEYIYNSLAELNKEWEDYEEPKEYWYIAYNGSVGCFEYDDDWQYMDFNWQDKLKQIGNYFETKEEAEKAVEKLKAWKRLKDYNVMFKLDFVKNKIDFTYSINNSLLDVLNGEEQIFNNMKIIFGGEE